MMFQLMIDSLSSPLQNKVEYRAIICRYLDQNHQIQEKYYCVKELDQLKAQNYLKEVISALKEYNIQDPLYFISTDGANVVSSDQNGLFSLLKQKISYLQSSQCYAHKVALGAKQLAKQFNDISNLYLFIYKICGYFNTENKLDLLNLNIHITLQKNEDEQILQLIKPLDVRCISYYMSNIVCKRVRYI